MGWRTFKVLAFWSEGKWQAQFLKLVPPFGKIQIKILSQNEPKNDEKWLIMKL